jgi:hypothetical protein
MSEELDLLAQQIRQVEAECADLRERLGVTFGEISRCGQVIESSLDLDAVAAAMTRRAAGVQVFDNLQARLRTAESRLDELQRNQRSARDDAPNIPLIVAGLKEEIQRYSF